ncbi:MAG TPA: glycosyltransferase family 1 protein [Pyrinomonadaceae bacterium]|jgi:glycosyltransferase involved in cell wall biosynthesis|nr:glycosyltransferase family 1 protein [Pyrinomonadaceae bacterium]
MATDKTLRRIGIVDKTSANWSAGASYTRMLAHSLSAACREAGIELFLFSQNESTDERIRELPIRVIRLKSADHLPGERGLRRRLGLGAKSSALRGETRLRHLLGMGGASDVFLAARAHEVSTLLPLLDVPGWPTPVKSIGWIPDFQHVYLPEFFSEAERVRRDALFKRLAERATLLMLSSRAALAHFVAFAPEHARKARVSSFPSLFAFEPLANEDALSSQRRFNLPEKFALVANQFWGHKNHLAVVEAVSRLNREGVRVPVVMTGLPLDHRVAHNQTISSLLQAIAEAGLSGQVIVLGQVAYADLVNLMRTAALIIQPSRFEGWSTVVEDAKALGRPLLCSDLPVHREQAPGALGFFPCDGADRLAELLAAVWPRLKPGPDTRNEERALLAEREFARLHGQTLLQICREANSA